MENRSSVRAVVQQGTCASRVVERWRVEYELTEAEVDILEGLFEGLDRRALAEARGVGIDTVKTQLRHLREKTGDASLMALMARALREV